MLSPTAGPYTTCYNRFVRWPRAGVWGRIMIFSETGIHLRDHALGLSATGVPPGAFLAEPASQVVRACAVEAVPGYRREHRQPLQQGKPRRDERVAALPHLMRPSASGSIRTPDPAPQDQLLGPHDMVDQR